MASALFKTAFATLAACLTGEPTTLECVVSGCAGELCRAKNESRATVCTDAPYMRCHALAICEPQLDNSCGWTSTPEFQSCLVIADRYDQIASNLVAPQEIIRLTVL